MYLCIQFVHEDRSLVYCNDVQRDMPIIHYILIISWLLENRLCILCLNPACIYGLSALMCLAYVLACVLASVAHLLVYP